MWTLGTETEYTVGIDWLASRAQSFNVKFRRERGWLLLKNLEGRKISFFFNVGIGYQANT